MKSHVSVMCSLALVASLASCAPTIQGPHGESYQPDVKVGGYMLTVQRVPQAELTEQTPETSYVELTGCSAGVVSVRDVRRLGIEQATQVCNQAVKKTLGTLGGVALAAALVFSAVMIYILHLFIK